MYLYLVIEIGKKIESDTGIKKPTPDSDSA
jgi:hypothetical protein